MESTHTEMPYFYLHLKLIILHLNLIGYFKSIQGFTMMVTILLYDLVQVTWILNRNYIENETLLYKSTLSNLGTSFLIH